MYEAQSQQVLQLCAISGTNAAIIQQLTTLVAGNEIGESGVAQLNDVIAAVNAAGVPDGRVVIDVSIARG